MIDRRWEVLTKFETLNKREREKEREDKRLWL
jgi:hypothetical protein